MEDNIPEEKQQAFRKCNLLSIRKRYVKYILTWQRFYVHVYNCCFILTLFHHTQKPTVIIRYNIFSTAALICNNIVTIYVTATNGSTTNIYFQCGQYNVPPVANKIKLFGVWWSNFSLRITCHVSICNSLPAQIRSVTYSNPLAMTSLLSETLLCALTRYAACYGSRNLCTKYIYFNISELIFSTFQNTVRNGATVRVKPWSGDRS